MKYKEIKYKDEVRNKLLEGVNMVADAVKITIGAKGKNVILDKMAAPPIITNDGVSIAEEINRTKDPFVNSGMQMCKGVARKTNQIGGDGTTTATVIMQALVKEGIRQIIAGADPWLIREAIEKCSKKVIEEIKKHSIKVKTQKDMIRVATISAEDEKMGKVVGGMVDLVGENGAITVEESSKMGLNSKIVKGMTIEQGYAHPYMITSKGKMEADYSDIPVLVTDQEIRDHTQILPLYEDMMKNGYKGLLIVCSRISGSALNFVLSNKISGGFNTLVVCLPEPETYKEMIATDIAIGTGAVMLSASIGTDLTKATFSDCGRAKRVISTQHETTIIEGAGDKGQIEDRIKEINSAIENAESNFDIDFMRERLARYTGGIGVITIGVPSEQEMYYKKHKLEDAINATRAAVSDGIIAGGGLIPLKVASSLRKIDKGFYENIFYDAMYAPLLQIAENAGKNGDTVVNKILDNKNKNYGWDAKNNEYKDLVKAGIIDPIKIVCNSIENAASGAAILLTSEAIVVEKEENVPQASKV